MFDGDIGQCHQPDLSFRLHVGQGFDRGVERNGRVRGMQLVYVDAVQAQSLQATFHRLTKMNRAGIMGPLAWSGTIPAALGRDNKVLRIRRERLRDQLFTNIRAIRISRVYEVDSQLNGAAKNRDRCDRILRWSPDSLPRNAHGSETKTVDRELTA